MSLFSEAAIKQQTRLKGELRLDQPARFVAPALLLASACLVAIVVLALGDYPRKETVTGVVEPEQGLVRVKPPRAGVVAAVLVREGETVQQGEPLIELKNGSFLPEGRELNDEIIESLMTRRARLHAQVEDLEAKHRRETDLLGERSRRTQQMIAQKRVEIDALEERVSVNEGLIERYATLADTGYQSDLELARQTDSLLRVRQQLASSRAALADLQKTVADLRYERLNAPMQHRQAIGSVQEGIEQIETDIISRRSEQTMLINAPINGRVSALTAFRGADIDRSSPFLTLIPEGGVLNVALFVPSSAIGRIEPGQVVRLRYQAFPHQRFGIQEGRVAAVGETVLFPSELPHSNSLDEAFYRVEVELRDETVSAYGRSFPLRPGMRTEADIIIERRSLISWLFDPILSATDNLW